MAPTCATRRFLLPALVATSVAVGLGSAMPCSEGAAGGGPAFRPWTATPGVGTPNGEYRYSLSVRVRPMLFWITKTGVGTGRIVWNESGGSRAFGLLIGSDPDRAPMHINRWGYVTETHHPGLTDVVGVMTEADEQTAEEAGRSVTGDPGGTHRFKAIRASVGDGASSAQVLRVSLAENFTLRDLPALLGRLPEGGAATARVRVPPGVQPGFLGAVADLVHDTLHAWQGADGSGRPGPGGAPRVASYVWDRGLYDLACSSHPLAAREALRARCAGCIESEFQVRNRATGKTSGFRLTYATDGARAGVPVRIVYRPRWWFEAELALEESR